MKKIIALALMTITAMTAVAADDYDAAIAAYRDNNYEEAYRLFTALHKAGNDDVQTLGYLGATATRRGDAATGLEWLGKAMEKLPSQLGENLEKMDAGGAKTLAWIGYESQLACKQLGDTIKAMKVLDLMTEALPDNMDLAEERATTLISLGCYEQGRALLRDIIARDNNAVRRDYCAKLLKDLGELPGSREWRGNELSPLVVAGVPDNAEPTEVVYASFPGGNKALKAEIRQRLVWPEAALRARQACRVVVAAKLDATGRVVEATIATPGQTREQDAEALRVVKALPPFNPASIDGQAVGATVQVPVDFVLPE